MEYIILFGLLAILLAIGVPVAFSLLAATLATVLYLALPPIVVFQQMGSDITSVAPKDFETAFNSSAPMAAPYNFTGWPERTLSSAARQIAKDCTASCKCRVRSRFSVIARAMNACSRSHSS